MLKEQSRNILPFLLKPNLNHLVLISHRHPLPHPPPPTPQTNYFLSLKERIVHFRLRPLTLYVRKRAWYLPANVLLRLYHVLKLSTPTSRRIVCSIIHTF